MEMTAGQKHLDLTEFQLHLHVLRNTTEYTVHTTTLHSLTWPIGTKAHPN